METLEEALRYFREHSGRVPYGLWHSDILPQLASGGLKVETELDGATISIQIRKNFTYSKTPGGNPSRKRAERERAFLTILPAVEAVLARFT